MFKPTIRLGLLALLPAAAPADAQVPLKIYGQELVDRTLAADRDLLVVVVHATPPTAAGSLVIASNIGQIGSPAGKDELQAIAGGKTASVMLPGGTSLKVDLPLLDVVGETIGALTVEWAFHPGSDVAALTHKTEQLRDRLSRRILNAANLFDPFPFVPAATTRTRAQKLVDEMQASHPEVEVLALRGRLGPSGELVLLGSTFGRHGKAADQDDLKVLAATAPATGVYSNGKRFGVDLPLHDGQGLAVGTMNVGYAYQAGADTGALVAQSLKLREEIQRRLDTGPLDALDP